MQLYLHTSYTPLSCKTDHHQLQTSLWREKYIPLFMPCPANREYDT